MPQENYNFYCWVFRAASYAMLGRSEAAKAATADALKHYSDLTIEGFTGTPDWGQAERRRIIAGMKAADFPACASSKTLAHQPQLVRLPECLAQ